MKQRIAVLGGGMGSLVAVHELTSVPGWRDRYDITVYQEGFRLGGKGASGRNPEHHDRIEEHGLHILFGFYDNAFRVMGDVYRELGRAPGTPLATAAEAFQGGDLIVMYEQIDGAWKPWPLDAPTNGAKPGSGELFLHPADYVEMLLRWAGERVAEWLGLDELDTAVANRAALVEAPPSTGLRDAVRRLVAEEGRPSLFDLLTGALGDAIALVTGGIAEDLQQFLYVDLAHKIALRREPGDFDLIVWLLDRFDDFLWSQPAPNDEARRVRLLIDFSIAMCRGLIVDDLISTPQDWFKVDDLDLRQWLKKHGAHDDTLKAPIVQGPYDAAFSTLAPAGAGTSVHGILRMLFTYKGHVYYRMAAGMGETIFTPLYEVLRRRGVKFEFFRSVERLEVSADGQRIAKIHGRKQATPKGGKYQPLIDAKGLPCWPSAPLYDQLDEGAALKASGQDLEDWWTSWPGVGAFCLEEGKDFDTVLLGISIGAFPWIAQELMAKNPAFDAMVKGVQTTQTQSFQLWMKPGLEGLGWSGKPPVVIPFAEPYDTWADMSHLLELETWPSPRPVHHCAYHCSSMEDVEPMPMDRSQHGYAQRQNERCKKNGIDWLNAHAGTLWPHARLGNDPKAFNWWFLYDRDDRDGEARFEDQYWRAPLGPSERYVLAVPGSSRRRLRADESGFENLFMAGDWTKTAMSIGCLESATMGGIQAARAIDPRVAKAIGDWLPDRPRPSVSEARAIGSALPALPAATTAITTAGTTPTSTAIVREPIPLAPVSARRTIARGLPDYIMTDGNQIAAPPIKIDVDVRMFMLNADYDALRAICDRELNLPGSPVIYRPLAPFVVLYCSTVDNYPQVDPMGWVPERDFGVWMPVVAGRGHGAAFVPERILTYTPYIWVDNGVALIGGRTVFGFAKQLGAMTLPRDPRSVAEYTLDTMVLEKYYANQKAVDRRLITVRKKDQGLLGELADAWRTGENVIDAIGDKVKHMIKGGPELPVPSADFAKELLFKLGRGMRMVFLKQFPDAHDGTKACYQAIVEAELPIVTDVQGGYLKGDWDVEIRRFPSHELVKTLGLKPEKVVGDVATVDSVVQGWAKFSAMVEKGTVIWETT